MASTKLAKEIVSLGDCAWMANSYAHITYRFTTPFVFDLGFCFPEFCFVFDTVLLDDYSF